MYSERIKHLIILVVETWACNIFIIKSASFSIHIMVLILLNFSTSTDKTNGCIYQFALPNAQDFAPTNGSDTIV